MNCGGVRRVRRRAILVWLGAGIAAWPASAGVERLENGALRLGVDPDSGRIVELVLKGRGENLIDPGADAALWEIELHGAESKAIGPARAARMRVSRSDPPDAGLSMVWDGFDGPEVPDLRVRAEVVLDAAAPLTRWTIALEGLGTARAVAVRFPRVGGVARRPGEVLAVPIWMGEATARARDLLSAGGTPRRLEWEYPGLLSMQCLAFSSDDGPSLYLACDDTTAFGKRLALFGDGTGGVGAEIVQLPADPGRQPSYRAPYGVLLGAFEGDWIDAAAIYRGWASAQPWFERGRLRAGSVPDWAAATGLWVWNRGRSENVLGPAAALQAAAGIPVSVFWHWWHGCAYDVGFPEYLPPREGAEAFRTAVAAARAAGLHPIVYMNQRLWGMTTASWTERDAARYAVKGADGRIRPEIYNTFTRAPCASMCMGTRFWRDTYAELAQAAVLDLGVDGIYMDQACSSLACYDPDHGHPRGGGTYWIEGFRALEGDIRRRCRARARAVTLAGEGCGEAWLPHLDLMLSLQVSMERYAPPGDWAPIPFFHAVYHGCFIPFGSYSSLTMPPYDELWPAEFRPAAPLALLDRKFAQQFRLEQARAFLWGQQPTLANFRPDQLQVRGEELAFAMRLARLRLRALEYFLHGTFLRPPALGAPRETIAMSRLSIYAGQQGALQEFSAAQPVLLAGAWGAAAGGVAVAVVNIGTRPQPVAFTLDSARWPIAVRGIWQVIDETGRSRGTHFDGGAVSVRDELPAMDARIYEFVGH